MLTGKKTYAIALGAILSALGLYFQDMATLSDTITLCFEALLAVGLRIGITTSTSPKHDAEDGYIGR